jgi:internalin A
MRQNHLTISFFVALSCFLLCTLFDQASEGQAKDMDSYSTFADFCTNKSKIDKETSHTVERLLLAVETSDCELANKRLSNLELLRLPRQGISSLLPLKSFKNLVELGLYENQVSDLTPLKSLTNLEVLVLDKNQITNISALRFLTKLRCLSLEDNRLTNINLLGILPNLEEGASQLGAEYKCL